MHIQTLPRYYTDNFPKNKHISSFQLITLAILATRMHLHLWHADRNLRGSDALMVFPMSDVSSTGRTP
jgi:polysaccharide deacetylase 2 family uncharacterized protein YibQ